MFAVLRERMSGLKSFQRGIHPPHRKKYSESAAIEMFVPKGDLLIPMSQHIGPPCQPVIKPRDEVTFGQKIADIDHPISAPIHAPLSGKTAMTAITLLPGPGGRRCDAIPIKPGEEPLPENFLADFLDRNWDQVEPTSYDPEELIAKIRAAGLVGMGGATFPTYFKLKRNPQQPVDTILLNGAECEPYLTADHRLMVECPEGIVCGLMLAKHACGADRAIIAIEQNKPDAIEAMKKAAAGRPGLEVAVCATKYPMGGERQLIPAVLGRTVPSAPKGLPLNVGVVVVNVSTAHGIARGVVKDQPFTHRVVTVTGLGVKKPGNYLAPLGTQLRELIDECAGGVTTEAIKVLAGGPMMGPTVPSLDVPVTKGVGGVTVMIEQETAHWHESACIRCGRCIDNCPLYLSPTKIAHAVKHRAWDICNEFDMQACCECGCCSFVCPAEIPLAQYIRAGKNEWRHLQLREKTQGGA
jgi:electron transport complex protein RnfC